MYELYGSILKPIFENVNYYISKKNPNYKDIYDKTKLYLEKLPNDYDLNADKYFPILAKSIVSENYKLGKYLFPNLKNSGYSFIRSIDSPNFNLKSSCSCVVRSKTNNLVSYI